ncbi:MAG: PRC-barrel domain-containing protein, partial [Caulobacteraceae bacterium]|nr:PRC-barrel domain-containing protein [Caulobacter sp.]
DGVTVGTVRDVWVETPEYFSRYLEVEATDALGGWPILLPLPFADIRTRKRKVIADSVSARQFARVPALADRDQITKREEDRINAYYAGGYLYKDAPEGRPA